MVAVTHPAITGYRIKMQDCVKQFNRGEGSVVTQEQLAECMGVQVTQAFRRHIAEMQTDGLVTRFTYQTDKGGYKVAYLINQN